MVLADDPRSSAETRRAVAKHYRRVGLPDVSAGMDLLTALGVLSDYVHRTKRLKKSRRAPEFWRIALHAERPVHSSEYAARGLAKPGKPDDRSRPSRAHQQRSRVCKANHPYVDQQGHTLAMASDSLLAICSIPRACGVVNTGCIPVHKSTKSILDRLASIPSISVQLTHEEAT